MRSEGAWLGFFLILVVVASLQISQPLIAEQFPLWGALKPGAHAVGFQTVFQYDPARPYKQKYDYEGKFVAGERARPVQISFWYPATPASSSAALLFEDYIALTSKEESSGEPTETEKQESINNFVKSRWAQGVEEDKLRNVLKHKTAAYRNAAPEKGPFPLVLVAQSVTMSYPYGNSILCEYLASHGYVVASSPGMGLHSRRISFDSVGVLTQMHDLELLIRQMRTNSFVDPDKLAVIGFSFGGMSASLLAMHNTDVEALVSLEGSMYDRFGYSVLFQNPLYEPRNLTVPLLHITTQQPEDPDTSFFNSLSYSNRYTIKVKGVRPTDFCSFGMIAAQVPNFTGPTEGDPKAGHETSCRYTLNFLNAMVKKDPQALTFVRNKPEANGFPAGFVISEFKSGWKIPPREAEFVRILKEKGIDSARAIYQQVKQNDPDYDLFGPEALNQSAQQLIQEKKFKDAIEILQLNLEEHDDFWLIYDILGQAYLGEGNKKLAIENFTKSLELNPENDNAKEMLKKLKES